MDGEVYRQARVENSTVPPVFSDTVPVDKAVGVVCKKRRKADNYRKVRRVCRGGKSSHSTIKTTSFAIYPKAKNGLRRKEKYTAIKLVVTDIVLGIKFAVLKCLSIK